MKIYIKEDVKIKAFTIIQRPDTHYLVYWFLENFHFEY